MSSSPSSPHPSSLAVQVRLTPPSPDPRMQAHASTRAWAGITAGALLVSAAWTMLLVFSSSALCSAPISFGPQSWSRGSLALVVSVLVPVSFILLYMVDRKGRSGVFELRWLVTALAWSAPLLIGLALAASPSC